MCVHANKCVCVYVRVCVSVCLSGLLCTCVCVVGESCVGLVLLPVSGPVPVYHTQSYRPSAFPTTVILAAEMFPPFLSATAAVREPGIDPASRETAEPHGRLGTVARVIMETHVNEL